MPSSILIATPHAALAAPDRREPTWAQRALRRRIVDALRRLRSGAVVLRDSLGELTLGDPKGPLGSVDLEVTSPALWTSLALGGDVGAGESFVAGHWRSHDVVGLLRLLTRDRDVLLELDGSWLSWPVRGLRRVGHWLRDNTRAGSARNIHDHYDVGDELFAQFLDPTMTYSAAWWARPEQSLEQAQREKLRRLCRLVDLSAEDELLEIGSGWGSLAMTAAAEFGARVTTTTISRNQFARASERVAAAGLEGRVTVLQRDYRDLQGRFDKLLSCEMIEAVGARHLPTYLRKCAALLRPGGALGLQAITIRDQHYRSALGCVDYIKKHVFPGSFIPSVTAITAAATRHTDLRLEYCEDFGPHYARTLAEWRQRLLAAPGPFLARPEGAALLRAWDYYFAYCEAGFRERHIGVCHLRLARS
ncbi:MAG: class I SAM-dependent methyltransferase [Planctomycetes bacterium]|nr:class I SAM-dependent methyltransferase [Planctomycetota bacterium]